MRTRWFALVLLVSVLLASCTTPTPAPTTPPATTAPATTEAPATTAPAEEPLYLAIIWHQHQPVYFKDPETGIYNKPWVRLHAAKDYYDMAAMLKQYPNVHVTFNLTPSLIRQLDDIATGAKDQYWVHTAIPAGQLTDDQKRFILRYFFDINSKIIARFPRYVELQAQRPADEEAMKAAIAGGWSEQDFRDLQVLFNLGWTDPDFLAQEPLKALVAKARGFSEDDKTVVLNEHLRILQEVIPLHQELQEAGQIEVTMTPFAHPILPLLMDTNLAKTAMPAATLPAPPFRFGADAIAQVQRGVELYQEHFDVAPRGMWPAEGSVAQEIVNIIGKAGLRWMASDEGVLAKSIGLDSFSRNIKDTVQEADRLYRPYTVVGRDNLPVAMVFRDVVISDKVGFTYSGLPGKAAATDFVNRLHAIRDRLKEEGAAGPHLVTVILDGENAWEYYENDGKEFLNSLYQQLSADPTIATVTPSEYLAKFPAEPTAKIENLWPGSWINHDFSTWIGEDEENRAWDYLRQVRELLKKYEDGTRQPPSAAALAEAQTLMYIAEGSDWFWWYGTDQNSGSDGDFDQQYRATLKQVLSTLGETPPDWLDVPIIAQSPEVPTQAAKALFTPTVDGQVAAGEWDAAGSYAAAGGAMAAGSLPLARLDYGFDSRYLYLHVETSAPWEALTTCGGNGACRSVLGFYLLPPGGGEASAFSHYGKPATLLGFGATRLLELNFANNAQLTGVTYAVYEDSAWQPATNFPVEDLQVAAAGTTLELGLPLALFAPAGGALDSGDRLQLRAVLSQGTTEAQQDAQVLPTNGPALLAVPDLGLSTTVLEIKDPEGDDNGPGTYTYPTDAVFKPGAFDATSFSVGYDDNNIIFKLTLKGPLENVWNSPNGLSIQTFDIYIDQDGPANGTRLLLPGRNAALTADFGWDYAIWAEGWTPGIYVPAPEGPKQIDAALVIIADPGQSKVTIKVPKSVLGANPEDWAYAAVVLGQEGYPASGVWRVRDVNPKAEQWRFGGGGADDTHTRILDLFWPAGSTPTQVELLGQYTPADQAGGQPPETFAQIPMLQIK